MARAVRRAIRRAIRVYVAQGYAADLTLPPAQSHHLCRVLRLKAGATLECFDGAGNVWPAEVAHPAERACTLSANGPPQHVAALVPAVELAIGLLKGEQMDRAVQRAVEAGVARIALLVTDRCNVSINARRLESRMGHWRRIIEASCTQCGQNHLPTIDPPQRLAEFRSRTDQTLFLHPAAPPLEPDVPRVATTMMIGPEGGWSPDELDALNRDGGVAVSIGTLILRAESAPLAATAALRQAWGWN